MPPVPKCEMQISSYVARASENTFRALRASVRSSRLGRSGRFPGGSGLLCIDKGKVDNLHEHGRRWRSAARRGLAPRAKLIADGVIRGQTVQTLPVVRHPVLPPHCSDRLLLQSLSISIYNDNSQWRLPQWATSQWPPPKDERMATTRTSSLRFP